jgi:hypothetical protein
VVPDPANVSPVVPPVKVNAEPVKAPPELPVIEIELAAAAWLIQFVPLLVITFPLVPAVLG